MSTTNSHRAVRRRKRGSGNFDRWIPREGSSWVFQVYNAYNTELKKNVRSYFPIPKYIYSNLKASGANWSDAPGEHLPISGKNKGRKLFKDLKGWSDSFNDFDNWVNLNILMSISSTFETYLASIISIAIQSDPDILLGSSKTVDSVHLLKHGTFQQSNYQTHIDSCTKGDWNSRISFYKRLFETAPKELDSNVSILESIRKTRNNIGHAFGRDIEESRKHGQKKIVPTQTLSRTKVLRYQIAVWNIAKAIVKQLLNNHIGEFQSLNFYHNAYKEMRHDVHINMRSDKFKKMLGHSGVMVPGKGHCRQLVSYYEAL